MPQKALWHHRNVSVLCQQSFIQRQWVPQNKKDDKEADDEEKYISREEAEQVIERLKGHPGKIKKVEVKTKKEQPSPFI